MRRLLTALLLTSFAACTPREVASPTKVEAQPLKVAVTFYPNEYFVQRIGAEAVEVYCDVPSDADALFWVPSDEELARMQTADLIVLQGAGMERWVDRAELPMSRVLVATKELDDRRIQLEAGSVHSHGNGKSHKDGDVDPHIWLDPENAKVQAAAILDRLCELDPGNSEVFTKRFDDLARELDALSADLRVIAERGESLCASHPAYAYLASRFGFVIANFNLDPSTMPTPDQIQRLAATSSASGAKILLWESEPLPAIVKRLGTECGLESLVYSPCELLDNESRAAGDDYLSVQRANVARLR